MRKAFDNRTVGFYLGLAGAGIAMVGALLLAVIAGGDKTFSLLAFLLLVAGAISESMVLLTSLSFAPLLPAVLIGAGTAVHLHQGIPSVTDILNDLIYIGGNGWYCIWFGLAFLTATLLTVISCFMRERRG